MGHHQAPIFLSLIFIGAPVMTVVTYRFTSSIKAMMVIAPINGFFTLTIHPSALFTSAVRSTSINFVFHAAWPIAWIFPIIADSMIKSFSGVVQAALALGSVYALGIALPWCLQSHHLLS